MYTVDFDELQWESPLPGMRFKSFSIDGKKLCITEFTDEFIEPNWRPKEHPGIVLSGEFEFELKGNVVRYPEGTAIFIPSGVAHAHKARTVTPFVRLFLVEEA